MTVLARSDEPSSKDVETIKIREIWMFFSLLNQYSSKKRSLKKDEMKAGDDLKFTVIGIGEHKRNDRRNNTQLHTEATR